MKQEREKWIDALRGLAMLLVICYRRKSLMRQS